MDDECYNEIIFFINTKNYPKRIRCIKCPTTKKNEKKKLRSKAKRLHLRDGVLLKGKQRLLRRNEITAVIENMHSGKYSGGHLGRDKTYKKVNRYYYWLGMKDDISTFVKDCDKCSRVTIAPPKTAPPLNPIPVPNHVWSLVGIDIIGPFETSLQGNKYIVAATDHFSKFSTAQAIPQKTAENVAKFLISMICMYGPMDAIITDQGKEFTNKVLDELTDELNIDHRISSAYHPQTNGQRERDNRTLKEMLCKVTNEAGTDWDSKLESALFAYRTSVHASTNHTPFEVMFGREARLVDLPNKETVNCDLTKEMFDSFNESRKILNSNVANNINKAQARQKKYYDQRNSSYKVILPGTKVLIKNASKIRRFGSKLAPRWIGPYIITETSSKGRVRLMNLSSNKLLSNVYHSSNLKIYTAKYKATDSPPKQADKNMRKRQSHKVKRPIRHQKKSLKKLKSQIKRKVNVSPSQVRHRFSPPSEEENQNMCELVNIPFAQQPPYSPSRLAKNPVSVQNIKGDGNCFFRAIAYAISGTEKSHAKVRSRIVKHMSSPEVSKKLEGYLNEKTEVYLNHSKMEQNAVWATDAEIMGASSLLQKDIIVYAANGTDRNGSRKYSWLRYPSTFSLNRRTNTSLYLRNDHDHFDVVLSC